MHTEPMHSNLSTATTSVGNIAFGSAFVSAVVDGDYGDAKQWTDFGLAHMGLAPHIHYSDSAVKRLGTLAF